jgi:hypothetical protein
MAKFALGDLVRTNIRDGIVRAIFTTKHGELTYAVEKDGALDFVDETKLSHQREPELAAKAPSSRPGCGPMKAIHRPTAIAVARLSTGTLRQIERSAKQHRQ